MCVIELSEVICAPWGFLSTLGVLCTFGSVL